MKRFAISFTLLLLALQLLQAQKRDDNIFFCAYGNGSIPTDVCSFLKSSGFKSDQEAEAAVDKIIKPIGLPRNFALVKCPEIENAVAITPSNGIRYIVYDNNFMQRISSWASDWAALSILAHEIGHHLSGHTLTGAASLSESRKNELEADRFSGFVMYKLGASLTQSQQAVRLVANDYNDTYSTHPSLSKRLAAIKEGWDDACSQDPRCSGLPDLTNFVFVQGGTFSMGSNDGDSDEKPIHQVTLSDFYLAINELTFDEYDAYSDASGATKPDDRGWGRGKRPVINVSWEDAAAYCNWRSGQDGLTKFYTISGKNITPNWSANGYRLPTEAEWEFAARSRGKDEKWAGTNSESSISTYANGTGSTDGYECTSTVGSFRANALGLNDMSGNVWEWCNDWYGTYPASSQTNPRGPDTGSSRVLRSGSWGDSPARLRCAYRSGRYPDRRVNDMGFRLARAAR